MNRIFGGEQNTRDENTAEKSIAKVAMIADEVTGASKSVVVGEHEERARLWYGLDLLRRSEVRDS